MPLLQLLPTLRSRLLLLMALAFVPLVVLSLLGAYFQWRAAVADSHRELDRLAQLAASNQQRVIEGSRQLVELLAGVPELRDPDASVCERFLRPFAGEGDWFANVGVISADGYLRCHSLGAPGVYLGDRSYFTDALAAGETVVGEYQVGRITGRATLNVARRMQDVRGKVAGVVYAALDLDVIAAIATEAQLPEGAELTVFDRNGTVLARKPPRDDLIGERLRDGALLRAALSGGEGHLELATPEHGRRHVAYAAVGGVSQPAMYVAVERSHALAEAAFLPALVGFLVAVALIGGLAAAGAWTAGTALVVRPVRAIIDAARRIESGDLGARTGLTEAHGELGELGAAFDRMTRALAERVVALEQAESDAETRERAYRQLFADNPLPMWIFDRETLNFLEVNAAALAKYGYSREEFLSMNLREIRPAGELARMEREVRAAPRGPHEAGVWKHLKKDGSMVLAETSTHDTVWRGRPARLVLAYDVTQREQARDALEQLQARYRALVELSPDPIHIHRDRRFVFLNAVAVRLFGANSAEEMVGRPIFEFFLPEFHAEIDDRITRIERGESVPRGEQKLRTLDGRVVDVEVSAARIEDEGRPAVMALMRDVTERRRAQRALEESEDRYRTLFDLSPDPIYVHRDGILLLANAAAVRFFRAASAAELSGFNTLLLAAEADRPERQERIRRMMRGEHVPAIETRLRVLDGTELDVELAAAPLRFEGEPAVIVVLRDVTERKRAQERLENLNVELERRVADRTAQLEASNRELEAFAYSVSHDLRAPLRTIEGFSQALLEDCSERLDDKGIDYLNRVCTAAQRMGNLIDDLLALSRVAKAELRRQPVDMSALARSILDELAAAQPARRTETRVAPGLTVQADPGMTRILLQNLLDNAWKFTSKRDDAWIELVASRGDGETVYCVRDNGAGFDMAYAGKLFNVFQRLHPEREFPGSGVGLAIAQRIVRRHGGRIWAEAEPGNGARFFFTLG